MPTVKPAATHNKLKQVDYARLKGIDKSHVTRLKQAGIVVMDGDKVDVAATDRMLAEQSDPAYDGVRQYHAKQRTDKADGAGKPDQTDMMGLTFQKARTANEIEKAKASKRENELAEGKLMVAADVVGAVMDAVTVLRNRLELPENLIAKLAGETDEDKIRAEYTDFTEHLLGELARDMQKIAEGKL